MAIIFYLDQSLAEGALTFDVQPRNFSHIFLMDFIYLIIKI